MLWIINEWEEGTDERFRTLWTVYAFLEMVGVDVSFESAVSSQNGRTYVTWKFNALLLLFAL